MKWLYGILCLFFLVIIHEFGHFLAAKLFGVKVESFSVGFGPILLHRTIKGTDYRLSLIPLGGYCGMKGEDEFKKAIEEDLPEIHAEKDSLYGVHPVKRALIGFAGPFFNFLFAFIAFALIAGIGCDYYTYTNKIVLASDLYENSCTVAEDAGLKTGDYIININGHDVSDFDEIRSQIVIMPEKEIEVTVLRDNQKYSYKMTPELNKETGTGVIGIAANENELIKKYTEKYGFFGSIKQGILQCFETISITFKSIGILFKGVDTDKVVYGPIRTTLLIGETVSYGFSTDFRNGIVSILSLLAIISMSLFIMNLLPVPVLDGGLILIALIDFITGKRLKPKIQYYIQFIGIAFIIVLAFIVLKGDILSLISGGKK